MNYKNLSWSRVFWILLLVALFIRFPFFFRDYIDRDESTFIIMGQSWVDGFLPYIQLWDLKPPITFLFFAMIIKVFGKSFIAIRFFGTVLVALTALFTYLIGLRVTTKKVSFWCAISCVCLSSLFGSLQGVMSEHISVTFFIAGVYILLSKEHLIWHFFVGVLIGLSIMSKLNMAYPFLTLGIYLIWSMIQYKEYSSGVPRLFLFGTGAFLSIALTSIPYYLVGDLDIWWESIFEAPITYSQSKYHSPLKTFPFLLVAISFFYFTFKKQLLDYRLFVIQVLLIIFSGVMFSFIQAGKINGHYLIQVYPFILIPFGMAVSQISLKKKYYYPWIGIVLWLIPIEAYLEYVNIFTNKIEKGSFFNGEGVDIPKYISENNLETENIFFTEYHIGYWMLGVQPPTKAATHPSNIAREALFPFMQNPRNTGIEELKYIMEVIQPKTVIARKGKKIFDKKLLDYNEYIDGYLEEHYELLTTIDRGLIYQRLE